MGDAVDHSFQELLADADLRERFTTGSGAHAELGLELLDAESTVRMRVPFSEKLTRSKTNRAIHASAVMTALDSAMGLATMMGISEPSSLATLELRYDELRCPDPESAIEVSAVCEDVVDDIAYLVATASNEGAPVPFARATGRFILTGAPSGFLEQALRQMDQPPLEAPAEDSGE